MQRGVSAILLLGGAALLATWLVSPASSAPQHPAASDMPRTESSTAPANANVQELRTRLDRIAPYAPATRDPFSFGARPSPSAAPAPATTQVAAPAPPALAVPRLVAIVVDTRADGAPRRAVFADGDDVKIIGVGGKAGALTVARIDADTVTLSDESTGAQVDVSVR